MDRIDKWIAGSPSPTRVMWVRGMAGRGKSTIVRTVARNWRGRAASAIFHVRRGRDAVNKLLVCALARQLGGSSLPEVSNAVLASVRRNKDIVHQNIQEQFEELFVSSFKSLKNPSRPILIIVDALDEFQNNRDAVEFVDLISRHESSLPTNVKFLLTSRPEARLLDSLKEEWQQEDLDQVTNVAGDLKLFIQDCFSAIKERRAKKHEVEDSWPSMSQIDQVVEMSQGLFQWARTAMAYIDEGWPPLRLRELLGEPSMGGRLDHLYIQILSKAFDPEEVNLKRRELLSWVLGTLVVSTHPVTLDIIAYLYADNKTLSEMGHDQIVHCLRADILGDLNSLLLIPELPTEPIRLLHTSVHDLLVDQRGFEREGYDMDTVSHHRRLRDVCLRLMGRDLKANMYNMSSLSHGWSQVRDCTDLKVPKPLRYCCRSWSI